MKAPSSEFTNNFDCLSIEFNGFIGSNQSNVEIMFSETISKVDLAILIIVIELLITNPDLQLGFNILDDHHVVVDVVIQTVFGSDDDSVRKNGTFAKGFPGFISVRFMVT